MFPPLSLSQSSDSEGICAKRAECDAPLRTVFVDERRSVLNGFTIIRIIKYVHEFVEKSLQLVGASHETLHKESVLIFARVSVDVLIQFNLSSSSFHSFSHLRAKDVKAVSNVNKGILIDQLLMYYQSL